MNFWDSLYNFLFIIPNHTDLSNTADILLTLFFWIVLIFTIRILIWILYWLYHCFIY